MQLSCPKCLRFCSPETVLPLFPHRLICRLCTLSSTDPQKGLLPRHRLEWFLLFSVYFPFQGRVGIGSYSNGYFSKFWISSDVRFDSPALPSDGLAFPTTLITQQITAPSRCPQGEWHNSYNLSKCGLQNDDLAWEKRWWVRRSWDLNRLPAIPEPNIQGHLEDNGLGKGEGGIPFIGCSMDSRLQKKEDVLLVYM